MDNNIKRVMRTAPIGGITPMGRNGYGQDEGGRIFRVTSVEQLAAMRKKREVGKDRRHFSFTHMQNIREITGDLSNIYCGYIVMLQPYIEWQTNRLVKGNTLLQRKHLASILCVSERTVKTVVTELKEREILFEQTDRSFTINERYHFRKKAGAEVDSLIKMFFSSLKKFNVKPADLGFVYKLLPYVHYTSNIICSDALSKDFSSVGSMNIREISEVVGMDRNRAAEVLTRLHAAGVVHSPGAKTRGEREANVVLNPYVFYRQKGLPNDTLRHMFAKYTGE